MSYVLGFFAADGYITLNKRGANFWSIQITDKGLLYKIKECVGAEHKISERIGKGNHKNLYRLQIGSFEMCNDLRKLGYCENKTKSLSIPKIPKKYFPDFVRGYFDGDGNVWVGFLNKKRPKPNLFISSVFTSCSLPFLEVLKNKLKVDGLMGGSFIKGRGDYYRLSYSMNDALKLYYFMYNDVNPKNNVLFLERKQSIFEKFLKMRA